MAASVYIESSVISYLVARPSRDVVIAARQTITIEWWQGRRPKFDVYISSLALTSDAQMLAGRLLAHGAIPGTSVEDALHIGIATAHGMEFLLTWNFKHINNAETKSSIARVIETQGFVCPVLCSPEELGA